MTTTLQTDFYCTPELLMASPSRGVFRLALQLAAAKRRQTPPQPDAQHKPMTKPADPTATYKSPPAAASNTSTPRDTSTHTPQGHNAPSFLDSCKAIVAPICRLFRAKTEEQGQTTTAASPPAPAATSRAAPASHAAPASRASPPPAPAAPLAFPEPLATAPAINHGSFEGLSSAATLTRAGSLKRTISANMEMALVGAAVCGLVVEAVVVTGLKIACSTACSVALDCAERVWGFGATGSSRLLNAIVTMFGDRAGGGGGSTRGTRMMLYF